MVVRRLISSSLVLLLMCLAAVTQTVNMNRPSDLPSTQQVLTPEVLRARLQNVQFQKDLDDLAALYSSLATDLNQVKEGKLPKDLPERMNRAEKLSKHVRQELTK